MEIEKIRQEIKDKYQRAAEAEQEFSKALFELRNIDFPVDEENQDEVNKTKEIGREIDVRTCYLLKTLLIQHGNVLFL